MKAAKAAAPFNILSGAAQATAPFIGMGEDGVKIPEYQEGGDVMQQILASQGQEQGGVPPRQDLPGAEDHESNPISMVAENGEVVGKLQEGR